VQIKRPGSTFYVAWQTGVTTLKANFTPGAGAGTYSFDTRIRSTATVSSSGYSTAIPVRVT
jgi:hypothetical protein